MKEQNKGKPTSDSLGLSAWAAWLRGHEWWGLCTLTMMRMFNQRQQSRQKKEHNDLSYLFKLITGKVFISCSPTLTDPTAALLVCRSKCLNSSCWWNRVKLIFYSGEVELECWSFVISAKNKSHIFIPLLSVFPQINQWSEELMWGWFFF